MTPPKRKYKLPDNLTFDIGSGRYRYRNPLTGKKKWFGRDKSVAVDRANLANKAIDIMRAKRDEMKHQPLTVNHVINQYCELSIPYKPWADSTLKIKLGMMRRYQKEFGRRLFVSLDRVFFAEWLDQFKKADSYNEHRSNLVDIWAFGISRSYADLNEPGMTLERSNSQKIKANQKTRQRLTLAHYKAIHAAAPPWLQIAMDISLITLQSRNEIHSIQDSSVRDGWLYFIRQKTSAKTDMAFLRIPLTEELRDLRRQSRAIGPPCPYWVNRIPTKQRRQANNNKLHRFAVTPDYITKTFKAVRDNEKNQVLVKMFADLKTEERPTFHEIRSLGGRIYRELGHSTEYVSALMAHTSKKMTEVYLDNPDLIRDDDFNKVDASLTMKKIETLSGKNF